MSRRSWQRRGSFLAAGLVLVAAAGLPLAAVLAQAVGASLSGFSAILSPRTAWLFASSLVLAFEVTLLSLIVFVPLGVALGRGRVPGRRVLLALHSLPVFLPPFLLALGWFHILGRRGLMGDAWTSSWFFGRTGVVLVLTTTLGPFITICTALGVRGVDNSLVEAGRLAASPLRVALRILIPLAWPAIAVGALLVFILAFAEVAVPMFLRVDVYPAAVFARLGGLVYSPAEAAVLALPVVLLALVIVALERAFSRAHADVFSFHGGRRELLPLGRLTWPAAALAGLGVASSWLPLCGLFARAWRGAGFADAWARIGSAAWNSLLVASVAATAGTLLAVVLGHGLARGVRVARSLDTLALAAFLTPAAVGGVGAISTWNRPVTAWVYGSLATLILCVLGRYAVVGMRVFAAGVRQRPASHEEVAAASGAGYLRRLFGIVIPESSRALAAAWMLVAVFCLRDVETAILVYPPGGDTLPVRIFTLEANGPPATVAALALFHVALTAAMLAATAMLFVRRRRPA